MHKVEEDVSVVLRAAKEALARGNVNFIRYELNELLQLISHQSGPPLPLTTARWHSP